MVKVDDDGVILLDDSSDEESEEEEVRVPRSRPVSNGSGGGSLNARTVESTRKASSSALPAASKAKKKASAPMSARKAAPRAGYDSDEHEHMQFLIREVISSSDGGGDDDDEEDSYSDGDASFDESTAFERRSNKRKRPASPKPAAARPVKLGAGGAIQTYRHSEEEQRRRELLQKQRAEEHRQKNSSSSSSSRKHITKSSSSSKQKKKAKGSRFIADDKESSDESGSESDRDSESQSDDELMAPAPRASRAQVNKKKALQQRSRQPATPSSSPEQEAAPVVRTKKVSKSQTKAAASAMSRVREYIDVLSGSSSDASSTSEKEEETARRQKQKQKQKQKRVQSSAFDNSNTSARAAPSSTTTQQSSSHQVTRRAAVVAEQPKPPPRTNGAPATSSYTSVYARTDHAFHQLTEKLSFSELQAQRRALEQLALMHKRSGGAFSSSSSAPTASGSGSARKPNSRLESRKTVVKQSRVDEIERRAKVPTPAKPAQEQPAFAVAPPSREAILSTMPPVSISSNTAGSCTIDNPASRATSSSLKSVSSIKSIVPPPAMHTTAWRRVRLARAPPNILSPESTHPLPFSDEYDRPLSDFDPTGTLEAKSQILASFGQVQKITEATFNGDSITQDEMNAKVQDLISDALPLLADCQERRVKSILRGTREHLQTYLREHDQMRSHMLRYGTPHSTFDLTYSERTAARRLLETRRHHAPQLNSLVGRVRYFVAHDTSGDSKAAGNNDSVDAAGFSCEDVPSPLVERAVFPETVIYLNDDIPALRKSWAYVGVKKNVHVADDPILRYIPYLGENTRVNIDPNRYSSTTMDKSKRVEVLGSKKGSVLELKSVVTSALDDEMMEYLLRLVVLACGDSKRVFEALQQSERFSQPYSDYCEIKKNDDAGRRVLKRVTGMQRLMADTSAADTAACAAEIRQYLRALGGSCWFLQPRPERQGLTHRLKPPIPFFESNYSRFPRGGGLRKTKLYSDATEWFRDLFCRRCYTYDCDEHGILQPTPQRRTDPINPVVRKAGLALPQQPRVIDVNSSSGETADDTTGAASGGGESGAVSTDVVMLDDSSSDDESVENDKNPTASASASDDESAVRRRSRRSQTRISTLASASLKVQEAMQEKERRRQRRTEARQLKQLTRGVDDSEYLDDSYLDTVMSAVQSLLSKEDSCSAACWKRHQRQPEDAAAAAAAASDASPESTEPSESGSTEAVVVASTLPDSHSFNDAEVLLIRKLSSTLGDNSCLISAMLRSPSCTCLQVSHFLALEQKARLSNDGEEDDDSQEWSRNRSSSSDMSNRRRQKNDRRSNGYSFSGNRELLKRTRAQRNTDKGNKHSYQPCNHEGICDGCECMKRGHNCDRACACPRDCPNRFQGCKCSIGNCRTKTCPCYGAGRECDPDYCFSCGASDAAVLVIGESPERRLNYDLGICCNANLLRGAQRKMGISFSTTHGWGAFALEPIRKGEFLYEYTGALISDDEAERRGNIYDVMAISFLFDVNSDEVVDATRKGNKSKFANHKALESSNCEAKILLVNGEHRIALYAREDIQVGEELFFDYGYTHETAPQWSQVKTRGGQRYEIPRHEMDLLEDLDDDDDDDDSDLD